MLCTQCGNSIPAEATTCPRCGTGGRAPYWQEGPHSSNPLPGTPLPATPLAGAGKEAFRFETRRWTRADMAAGGGTLVLIVSLFLPWYGVDFLGITAEVDGLTAHGYLYLVLILGLAILGYLVLVAGFERLPVELPLSHRQLMLSATVLDTLIVLAAFVFKPTATGWRFGAFAGLAGALVAVIPVVLNMLRGE